MDTTWKVCSACKKPIAYGSQYWVCSVSTCNRARNPYVFDRLECWDSHVPVMNHRDAWAEERTAPNRPLGMGGGGESGGSRDDDRRRRIVRPAGTQAKGAQIDREVLIVVSKLKKYLKDRHGVNTSGDVADVLSDRVRLLCDEAVDEARTEGRKTLMGRDFK